MGRNIKFVIVFAVLVGICAVVEKGDAATYVVGDSLGWTIPSGPGVYPSWASQHVFRTGDTLVFNFPTGVHDVATVTKAAFDGCSSISPISLITVGPANVTLDSSGEAYFICTFGQHCAAGQKLAINVTAASSPAPSPPPAAPAPGITPPTPTVPTPAPRTSPPVVPAPAPAPTPRTSPPGVPAPAPTPNITPPGAPPAPTPAPSIGGTSPSPSSESTPAPPPGGSASPPSPPPPSAPGASPPGSTPPPPPPGSDAARAIATSFALFASIAVGIAI